jgi:hypothetical protein
LHAAVLREQAARQCFRQTFFTVVRVTDRHLADGNSQAIEFMAWVRLDYICHPFLEALGRQTGNVCRLAEVVLYEVMLASEVAVDFGD